MTFQRIILGLLILTIAGLAGSFYVNWKMATQLRSVKAFVEGSVFAEAVCSLREGPKHDAVQMEYRNQNFGDWIELGEARQVHHHSELHARCRQRLLRLRSDQEESRHRLEFPGAGLKPQFPAVVPAGGIQ